MPGERVEPTDDNAPQAGYLRAQALLRRGDFENGWREYEWRLKVPGTAGGIPPDDWPRWDGRPMPEGRLLIFCDQGRGDVIQFARYIRWAADRCPDLAVCCPGEMWPILRQVPRVRLLVEHWYEAGTCAAYVPICSLPFVAGTRLDSIPAPVPYLRAPPVLAAHWRSKLDRWLPLGYRRIGLVWAGNPNHFNDHNRSMGLRHLRPLLDLPRTAFVSLQHGAATAQLGAMFGRAPLINIGAEDRGFRSTMAVLESLDLVISVDTSVAHLAGAMDRPAMVLLAHFADWRWLEGRDTSPWYPSLRLFRQPEPGAWDAVVVRIRDALVD